MNNSIMIIHPYWKHRTWCFSDDATGLVDEPFVSGADIIISLLVAEKGILMDAEKGFNLIFSATPFPEWESVLHRDDSDMNPGYGGTWYNITINHKTFKGWLCPALFKYFNEAPKQIYVKVQL